MSLEVHFTPTFDSWRDSAREHLIAGDEPDDVVWIERNEAQQSFAFGSNVAAAPVHSQPSMSLRVPKVFLETARFAAAHRDPRRWSVLYRLLWRLQREGPQLMEIGVDDDVFLLQRWAQVVKRDIHKMHAFVRFRQVNADVAGMPPPRDGQDPALLLGMALSRSCDRAPCHAVLHAAV